MVFYIDNFVFKITKNTLYSHKSMNLVYPIRILSSTEHVHIFNRVLPTFSISVIVTLMTSFATANEKSKTADYKAV